MNIDWKELETDIQNIKNKHFLLLKFFNLLDFIEDKYASIIIRYIMKHHIELFFDYPIYILCQYIPKKRYPETIDSILKFYEIIKEKIKLITLISKWYKIYKNREFWELDIDKQIQHMIQLKSKFNSLFDSNNMIMNFNQRFMAILKINNSQTAVYESIESAKDRLQLVVKLFGLKFIDAIGIPIITREDYEDFSSEMKIKYINLVYSKILHIINQTTNLFENLYLLNLKFDNLLNPFFINIVEDTLEEDSVEDMSAYFKN